MGKINSAIAENIRQIRTDLNISQQELADRITSLSGETVTRVMVAKWERGETIIPAEMAHYISSALGVSSYKLWPHSNMVSDKDITLINMIRSIPDDEKDDMIYLLTQWHGDTRALLKLDVIHAVLPEWRRAVVDNTIIEEFKEAVKVEDADMDCRIKTDLPYVLKAFRKLDK